MSRFGTAVPHRATPSKTRIPGIIAMEITQNRKTGPVSSTSASQSTCPNTCVFYKAGCYAETGPMGFQTGRLNREADGLSPMELAQREADAIDGLTGRQPLRMHVVGDSTTRKGTRLLAAAALRYIKRKSQAVWTYTHAWKSVPRADWGAVSVLASCESTAQVKQARARGYATALVVEKFETDTMYKIDGERVIPCPEQTRGIQCIDCQLCMRDDFLRDTNTTIAFEAHGSGARRVREAIHG